MSPRLSAAFLAVALFAAACGSAAVGGDIVFRGEAESYVTRYAETYVRLYTDHEEALWKARAGVDPRDDSTVARVRTTAEALREFTGSLENIGLSRAYLSRENELPIVLRRQLQRILFLAGDNPAMAPDLVRARVDAEASIEDRLHGFEYKLDGQPTRLEALDSILVTETDLARRRAAWRAAQAPGAELSKDVARLRWLRNEVVKTIGHTSFLVYRAGEYDMAFADIVSVLLDVERELRPMYVELHTYVRHELARRYGQPVPDLIPAHWLPTRFGDDWSALFDDSPLATDADAALETAREAETICTDLGLVPLPPPFWERSSLVARGTSADSHRATLDLVRHIDLGHDVRALAALDAQSSAFARACRVIGEAHAFVDYAAPEMPILLRRGASPAFHAAHGELLALATSTPRAIASRGKSSDASIDEMKVLLDQALDFVVAISWSAGTLFQFEREIYEARLPAQSWNGRFWTLASQHQGIVPPEPRDGRWCDPICIPGFVERSTESIDRALSIILAFQLHEHVARRILDREPRNADYSSHPEIGNYIHSISRRAAATNWRSLLREKTGYDVSARAMVDYFAPLRAWLAEENRGRRATISAF